MRAAMEAKLAECEQELASLPPQERDRVSVGAATECVSALVCVRLSVWSMCECACRQYILHLKRPHALCLRAVPLK